MTPRPATWLLRLGRLAAMVGWWVLGVAYLVGWIVFDDVASIPAWYWLLWRAPAAATAALVEARANGL